MIRRWIVLSPSDNLHIEYAPRFKLHKCPKTFPHPETMIAHHPYFLDFSVEEVGEETGLGNFSFQTGKRPDFESFKKTKVRKHINQADNDRIVFTEIMNLINALAEPYIFTYDGREAWTTSLRSKKEDRELRYSREGYIPPEENVPTEIVSQEHYLSQTKITLHSEDGTQFRKIRLNDLLDLYYNCENEELKRRYLNACLVVDKAKKLAQYEMSASYVFLVSAIEALVAIEEGEGTSKVSAKFKAFIRKYGWEISGTKIDEFYDMRSSIAHVGKLLQSSYSSNIRIKNQEDLDRLYDGSMELSKYRMFQNLVETCFGTFIYVNMQNK